MNEARDHSKEYQRQEAESNADGEEAEGLDDLAPAFPFGRDRLEREPAGGD